jgi:hypothetical protein
MTAGMQSDRPPWRGRLASAFRPALAAGLCERLPIGRSFRLTRRFVERRCDAHGSRGMSRLDADRHFPQKEGGRSGRALGPHDVQSFAQSDDLERLFGEDRARIFPTLAGHSNLVVSDSLENERCALLI